MTRGRCKFYDPWYETCKCINNPFHGDNYSCAYTGHWKKFNCGYKMESENVTI